MKTILARFKEIANNEMISISHLEASIGASKGVLSRAINNNTDIQVKWLLRLIEKYPNYNAEWLLTGNGPMLRNQISPSKNSKAEDATIPLYDIKNNTDVKNLFSQNTSFNPVDFIRIPCGTNCEGALYIKDDSMYPLLNIGDIVLFKALSNISSNVLWGSLYITYVEIKNEVYFFIRNLYKSNKKNFIILDPHNKNYQPIELPIDSIKGIALVKSFIKFTSPI